jgi:hypothetical protein
MNSEQTGRFLGPPASPREHMALHISVTTGSAEELELS